MATVIHNLLPGQEIICFVNGVRHNMTPGLLKEKKASGCSVQVPVFYNGSFALRSLVSIEETVNKIQTVRHGKLGSSRFLLSPSHRVLVTRRLLDLTSESADGSTWLPAMNLKDGIDLRLCLPPTKANRLMDLGTKAATKVKTQTADFSRSYHAVVLAEEPNLSLSSGVVIS